jgi:hypothetical protein
MVQDQESASVSGINIRKQSTPVAALGKFLQNKTKTL